MGKSRNASKQDEWGTPRDLFQALHAEFAFTVDACARAENAKLPRYWSPAEDGLSQSWARERVWCHPPYGSALDVWADKVTQESPSAELIVSLLPCRLDVPWFLRWIDQASGVRFLIGRLRFQGEASAATFPSCLVIHRKGQRVSRHCSWWKYAQGHLSQLC